MFKFLKEKKKDNKGFTLVELVVVIAILAILVGLLAPQYTKYVERSRKSADASNLENMARALEIAAADTSDILKPDTYTITIDDTDTKVTTTETGETKANVTAAEGVITKTVGENALATKLKSKQWASTGATNQIQAIVKIESDYTVSVSYTPDAFYSFIGKDKKASTTGGK
ncbi:prepilin-type N-terminal cleavage/methylation domain-containing protein [Blautia wexlerae]|uniref:Prepilin-type N-terminal cleavage/methylation domain-containing protein n=1 Tax=Blautia wexlerae TaxID=418240 RepID=A0ABX2GQE7_9FIRM|nr:prepilin-type N-terminal cleavage/methylation domain-containing protein [Blautia wexlerae]NSF73860.1 prepilin-type N-terminal cleavage/methylation domain-containing protein [Blautia wexlerae]